MMLLKPALAGAFLCLLLACSPNQTPAAATPQNGAGVSTPAAGSIPGGSTTPEAEPSPTPKPGFSGIYRVDLDSGDVVPVAEGMRVPADSVWSPDGRFLAMAGDTSAGGEGRRLRLLNLATGQTKEHPIPGDAGGGFVSWSADGARLAVSNGSKIFLVDLMQETVTEAWAATGECYAGFDSCPSFALSPDGGQLAVMLWKGRGLPLEFIVADLSTGVERSLASMVVLDPGYVLRWSPSRDMLAFEAVTDTARPPGVFMLAVDGGSIPVRVADGVFPRWSPDGETALIQWFSQSGPLLSLSTPLGEGSLLASGAYYGCWSPEGDRVAYLALDGYIYEIDVQTKETRRITSAFVTSATNSINQMAWSADGRSLFFYTTDPSPGAL